MTFYSVISGLLFLAACQAFLHHLGTPAMFLGAILVITILNESVLTSELIEHTSHPIPYTLSMKLLDFFAFTVLLWTLLVLNPTDENSFQIDVESKLWGANDPRFFWGLLTVYWLIVLAWNQVAKQRNRTKWKPWFYKAMHGMWLPPLVAAIANWNTVDLYNQASWTVWLSLAFTTIYLLSKLKAPLNPVTATDDTAQAMEHAGMAKGYGEDARVLLKHVEESLKHAQASEKQHAEQHQHMSDAVKHLKEAIQHAKADPTDVATNHIEQALMHLHQSTTSEQNITE